jgi:hypothetical protein
MVDLIEISEIFSPVIIADKNPFIIETTLTKKVGGEIIIDCNKKTVHLFELDRDIIKKIIQLSPKSNLVIPKFNWINRLLFRVFKKKFQNKISKIDSEFYLVSKNLSDKLLQFGVELPDKKLIKLDNLIIIGSLNTVVIDEVSNKIWFDYTKFKVILIK